jgi:hypothetical protein
MSRGEEYLNSNAPEIKHVVKDLTLEVLALRDR